MARSTKTKHVMSLVGAEPVKKTAHPPKPAEKPLPPMPPLSPTSGAPEEAKPEPSAAKAEALPEIKEAPHEEEQTEQAVGETLPVEPEPTPEPEPVQDRPRITAVVCELINQELASVAERFHLSLTDGNLWELTKAALEEVRPEFAADSEELEEKCERLRPKVIKAMTKAAIKVSAKGRNAT